MCSTSTKNACGLRDGESGYLCLVPIARPAKASKTATTRPADVKVVGSWRMKSYFRTLKFALSKVVRNKVTEAVSRKPTVENN